LYEERKGLERRLKDLEDDNYRMYTEPYSNHPIEEDDIKDTIDRYLEKKLNG